MERFVYVYTTEARDKLIAAGYRLIKANDQFHTYVFENKEELQFALSDVSCIKSNTLTF